MDRRLRTSFRAEVQYLGTYYYGWQKQVEQKLPTIQETLEKAISCIIKNKEIYTVASGRTDAGVHAFGQIIRIDLNVEIPAKNLKEALDKNLPSDIRITSLEKCDLSFHPQKDALSKEYHYHFSQKPLNDLFESLFVERVYKNLDMKVLEKACKLFVGRFDFSHYYCEGTPVNSYIREIYECSLVSKDDYYLIKVRGNGFLKQMVRLIVGTLWAVAEGKIELFEIETSLMSPDKIKKRHLAALAPAKGLCLYQVNYPL